MAKFAYKAINKEGKDSFGIVEADTQALAINDIRNLGLYPTQVREARRSDERRARKKKGGGGGISEFYIGGCSQKMVMVVTRQLATLIDAGLPLLRSLNILIAQQKPSKLRDILREVTSDVQSGATFSEGLAKHPKAFDRLYVNMVRAGEVGGMLEVVLNRLAVFMERRQTLRRQVRGAMIYPLFVIVVATGIVLFLLTYVVPIFDNIFSDFGAALPWSTRFLMDSGDYLKFKWWKLLLIINSTIITIKILAKIRILKEIFDRVILKVPLIGDFTTKVSVARFARTLGTLITSGVPILQSLKITKETVGNVVIQNAVQKTHDSIREGDTMAAPLDEAKCFPAMVVNMIDVGEETGSLDAMLGKVADIYDSEVEIAVEALLRLIEPALIVALGGIIGFIVISLYLPIFALSDVVTGV